MPLVGGGKFEDIGEKIRLPDDVTMGYVAEHLLATPLTVISDFHSHMEPHKALPGNDATALAEGISYSYVLKEDSQMSNILEITDGFPLEEDPTRYVFIKVFSPRLFRTFWNLPDHKNGGMKRFSTLKFLFHL